MFGELKNGDERIYEICIKMVEYCSLKYDKHSCNFNFCNYPEIKKAGYIEIVS